jgi:hypothetical protein
MAEYYWTDPDDPDAPVQLEEYQGIQVGDTVTYANPSFKAWLPEPLVVSGLYRFDLIRPEGGFVTAILNDGEWEVNADNLRKEEK